MCPDLCQRRPRDPQETRPATSSERSISTHGAGFQARVRLLAPTLHNGADEDIEPYLSEKLEPITFGQLERARDALLRTTTFAAKKMGITRQSYAELERSEREGKITLEKLQQAANAIDCELLYAIRPKERKVFSRVIFDAMMPFALEDSWTLTRPKNDKGKALYAFAKNRLRNTKFRRKMRWTERIWVSKRPCGKKRR